jgi:hypothetical protein
LIQIVDRIVHDDIDPVAQLIVEQVGYGLYIILSCFDRVFSYVLTARIKVGNEMVRLIILPVDVLVLYTILTKFYFGRLSRKIGGEENRANSNEPDRRPEVAAFGFKKGSDEIIAIKLRQHIEKPQ